MCAVPYMAVFWSSLTSCFPGMLLTYFLNEIVPVAPIITGIIFVFTFHMRYISIVRSLYFRIFSASFLITFLSHEIATSINIHVPFSLSRIIMSGLLLGIVLSVCICWFQNMVTLSPCLVSTGFGTCSYQCFIIIIIIVEGLGFSRSPTDYKHQATTNTRLWPTYLSSQLGLPPASGWPRVHIYLSLPASRAQKRKEIDIWGMGRKLLQQNTENMCVYENIRTWVRRSKEYMAVKVWIRIRNTSKFL